MFVSCSSQKHDHQQFSFCLLERKIKNRLDTTFQRNQNNNILSSSVFEMSVLNQWFTGVQDLELVNGKIKELEAERLELQQLSDPNHHQTSSTIDFEELSKQLKFSIANSDIDTINALITGHGDIPSLVAAKNLVLERQRLLSLKSQQSQYKDLDEKLNEITYFDLIGLKELKNGISELTNLKYQATLYDKLDQLIISLKPKYQQALVESAGSSKWVNSSSIAPNLETDFHNLLNLQSLLNKQPKYPDTLWAFETLASNFKISFDYHFNTEKETNRIDRPELFLNYFTNYLSNHLSKFVGVFQLQDTEYSDRFAHSEFITALLKPVREKFSQVLEILRSSLQEENPKTQEANTQLLIHLIKETITFDQALVSDFYYDPLDDGNWEGLFALFNYTDLEKWLNYETKLNVANFESIINSSNCFHIDYTSVGDAQLKPTVSAIKLKYLFENITNNFSKFFLQNYENNSSLKKFKLKFFAKIYLRFLESYFQRLEDGFIAFNELFKKSRSVIHSAKNNTEIDITGTKGLERLFRIYCSLKYTINSLNYWNQEFIFIELNSLFNEYSTNKTLSLFSSILSDYNSLAEKTLQLINSFYSKTTTTLLRNYTQLNDWNDRSSPAPTTFTAQLASVIDTLQELNQFTVKVISTNEFLVVKNSLSYSVADYFFNNIIKSNHFSHKGIKQLELDFSIVWEKLQLSRKFPLYKKLIEAFQIMNLDDEQITQFGPFNTVNQFAKFGHFEILREVLQLEYLTDSDLLDLLLRIT